MLNGLELSAPPYIQSVRSYTQCLNNLIVHGKTELLGTGTLGVVVIAVGVQMKN